jgi:hypothetical protein
MSKASAQLIETVAANFLSYRSLRIDLLVSICFLCDWKHLIDFERTITNSQWLIEGNRIKSAGVESECKRHPKLAVEDDWGVSSVFPRAKLSSPFLNSSTEKTVCNHVLAAIKNQSDFNIHRIVISTYPFNYSGELNLVAIRNEYIDLYGREYSEKRIA